MTRGVLLAWLGAGVAALAILAALFWPMEASVSPLPAANMTSAPASVPAPAVAPTPVVAAPPEEVVSSDARGRVLRQPNHGSAAVPPVAAPVPAAVAPVAVGPAPVHARVPTTITTTTAPAYPGSEGAGGGGVLGPGGADFERLG